MVIVPVSNSKPQSARIIKIDHNMRDLRGAGLVQKHPATGNFISKNYLSPTRSLVMPVIERYVSPVYKWKSEQIVFELTQIAFKNHRVIYQHRPSFLKTNSGQMSYDVFICGINVAIEYQGKQHFEPVEIFGGEKHFADQKRRDELKRELSIKNKVTLVYINYWDDISADLIRERVNSAMQISK